jgi:UDP-N-acetylglucosamine 1-carboxyvinyltransferase
VEQLAEDAYAFCARDIDFEYLKSDDYRQRCTRLRGSVMLIGPMLARFGVGYIPKPGGDKIGRRRLDTHFLGFQKLGAKFNFDIADEFFMVEGRELKGTYMLLDEASVTGTANIVMAAVMAKGRTTIYNAACEPYLQQLCKMLNRMGAKISGIASNLLEIEGVEALGGTEHRLLPDMIEVGSFIGMAAMNRSELTIKDVSFENLGIIPAQFARMGIRFEQRGDDIHIPQQDHYSIDTFLDGSIMTIADAPWPGLTPDLLSIFLVVATQANGAVLIHQKMFESRLFFVDKLIDMGAQIILCDPHRATVIGHDHRLCLRATRMTSPDIRAGVALLIAAMSAEGVSTIQNIDQIDRGYKDIDGRLNALGAKITRIDDCK